MNGNGALDDYVTIVAPDGTTIENARVLRVPTSPAPPKDVEFGYGLFDYDVKVAKSGDAADVKFILPDGADAEHERVHAPEQQVDRGDPARRHRRGQATKSRSA